MSWLRFWRRTPKTDAEETTAFFGGRRFSRKVPYLLPNDDEEINRLDFQHYMLRYAMKGNYAAPIGNRPRDILDVACGTGRWASELAQIFPLASVVGFDIKPLSESATERPSNFRFVEGNMLEGLPFPDNSFDFVHQRLVVGALPTQLWVKQIQELLRVTRPKGWVELVEAGHTVGDSPAMLLFNELGERLTQPRGLTLTNAEKIGEYMREAGARDVQQRVITLPYGKQKGRLGAMAEADGLAIISGVRGYLIALGAITEEEFTQRFAEFQEEIATHDITWPFYVAWGQK